MVTLAHEYGVMTIMAVSASVGFLLALRHNTFDRFSNFLQFNKNRNSSLRSCLASGGKRRWRKKKKVRFAEDLVKICGVNEEYPGR
ncbi:hypothetical protein SUGI_0629510 [Cryptomeria japonica]|nr:hypothetical protein SUGI_0629510 [Cryptomeria japonica]